MVKDYNEYLNDIKDIIGFIKNNDLAQEVNCADLEAKHRSGIEGNQFLHSYRYSFVYDAIREKNIESISVGKKALEIVKVLENPYNKDIEEIIYDSYYNDMEIN